jgi:hypothetical protein
METAVTLNNLRTIVLVVPQHVKNKSEKQTAGWPYPLTIVEGELNEDMKGHNDDIPPCAEDVAPRVLQERNTAIPG